MSDAAAPRDTQRDEPRHTSQTVISAIIVDDEQLAREEMAYLLKAHPDIAVLAEGRNGVEALQLIREHQPDLVFLDVNIPGQDGLELARRLLDRRLKIRVPHIIFATAYDHYAVQAFELNAVDYLLKPIDKSRLAQSIQRVRKLMEMRTNPAEALEGLLRTLQPRSPQQSKVLLRSNNRMLLIDARDLVFASIEDGRITLATRDLEGESNYRTIEDLQDDLGPEMFWRVHRSFLINVNHIREVVPWFKGSYQLRMNDRKSTEVPVSRTQTKRLRELFKL